MNQRTRKSLTIYKALSLRDDTDRLFVIRKERGSELATIEDCVDGTIQEIEEYARRRKEVDYGDK